jgi:hypothetical protein
MFDFISGKNEGFIQAYQSVITLLNNGSISHFSQLSTQSRGEVCTSIAYNSALKYTISACDDGNSIFLYLTLHSTFKPFAIGPI